MGGYAAAEADDEVYRGAAERWREANPAAVEWVIGPDVCLVRGCLSGPGDMDTRGPVVLRDGSYWKACTRHWEAIVGVSGRMVSESRWELGPDADGPVG